MKITNLILFLLASLSIFATAQPVKEIDFVSAIPETRKAPKYPKMLAKRGKDGWVDVSFVV